MRTAGEPWARPVTVVVLAKLPAPGQVKTRLCPPCTLHEAATVAEASLRDTVDVVAGARHAHPDVFGRPAVGIDRLGGAVPSWISDAAHVFDQGSGDLGARLAHAFRHVTPPAILIGMDTPQVTIAHLLHAANALASGDSVIGHATDGGFWIIGFNAHHPTVFDGVTMSTDRTGVEQERSMRRAGLDPVVLESLTDFDVFDDALSLAELLPGSRFRAAVDEIERRIGRPSNVAGCVPSPCPHTRTA